MLDNYQQSQKYAYRVLTNTIKNQKYSHAYLIETNNYAMALDFIKSILRAIFCNKSISQICNCSTCQKISNDNFSEVQIVEPDGMWYKKEQIDNLQKTFSTKSIESTKRVYLITDASKLNTNTANSILKFLEEPEEGIIAFLMVENRYQLLETIISRCQIISLKSNNEDNDNCKTKLAKLLYNSSQKIEKFLNSEEEKKKYEEAIEFIKQLETKKRELLLFSNKYFHQHFQTKEDIELVMDILIYIYRDSISYLLNKKSTYFDEDIIKKIITNNNVGTFSKKIGLAIEIKDKIKYNVNNNLLIDQMIIKIGGINND